MRPPQVARALPARYERVRAQLPCTESALFWLVIAGRVDESVRALNAGHCSDSPTRVLAPAPPLLGSSPPRVACGQEVNPSTHCLGEVF